MSYCCQSPAAKNSAVEQGKGPMGNGAPTTKGKDKRHVKPNQEEWVQVSKGGKVRMDKPKFSGESSRKAQAQGSRFSWLQEMSAQEKRSSFKKSPSDTQPDPLSNHPENTHTEPLNPNQDFSPPPTTKHQVSTSQVGLEVVQVPSTLDPSCHQAVRVNSEPTPTYHKPIPNPTTTPNQPTYQNEFPMENFPPDPEAIQLSPVLAAAMAGKQISPLQKNVVLWKKTPVPCRWSQVLCKGC
ncbi:OLC1v1018117C1 [Oldenlandia corymbosa var. corymbosa]|uniref:OLC1v1018117C1 n=1 Tax=Oldenlandia corymbosa var. corymbosa TaxID=529605 RepID=A0AAV1EB89_OLDCO|nr:OLC1v1018117C1 [Oldenlandia corymbosa var. corymbosa]